MFKTAILTACASLALLAGPTLPSFAGSLPVPAAIAAPARLMPVSYNGPHHYWRHHRNPPGYHVNRMGYGNYTPGPNGSFAGYPAGSAGAQIMRRQQQKKCLYAPESC